MGVVYRAHDERLDRDVALKIICPGVLSSVARRRFHTEALVLSKINHPNIATVYDFDSQDGTDFLVTELIPGLSLEEMLVAGALPEKEIIALGSQLADGLTAAHSQQVIHRDLKPSNIRVTPDARLKILDFGLARIVHRERPVDATASTPEMQGVSGTLPYMAPEQLLNHKLDARVDIWGLGCILYEMATGRRPFLGSGPALVDAVLHHEPPHVGKLNPNISTALNNVIFRCLEKDPQKRYRSAHEIATDLRRVSSRTWLLRVFKRPARLQAAKAAVVGLALAVAMAFYWWPYPRFAHGPSRRISSPAPNPQPLAHDFYLQGLGYLERFDKPGNLDSAIALFQQAVKADPGFALAFSALGEAYWGKYRLDQDPRWVEEAERSSRRAAELNDQLPAVYVTLARIHNGKGQHNLALQEIQRALKLEPRDADAVLGLAAVYESMGREHEAEGLYAKGASFRPTYWGGFYELGVFYYHQRRYEEAAAQFRRVLEVTPDNALAHATLGGSMVLVGNEAEAEQHFKQSIALDPTYAAYTNLGALYIRQKRWAESASMTRKALELNSKDYNAWANLGVAYEWLGQTNKAEDAYREELARLEQLAKLKSDDPDVQSEIGLLYSKQRLRNQALPRVEAALARAPDNPDILVSAAEAYENLGDRNQALRLTEQALAAGATIKDLAINPGLRKLVSDPQFSRLASKSTHQ